MHSASREPINESYVHRGWPPSPTGEISQSKQFVLMCRSHTPKRLYLQLRSHYSVIPSKIRIPSYILCKEYSLLVTKSAMSLHSCEQDFSTGRSYMTSGRCLCEIDSCSTPSGTILLSASPNHTIFGCTARPNPINNHGVSELFAARYGTAALSFVFSWQPHSIE